MIISNTCDEVPARYTLCIDHTECPHANECLHAIAYKKQNNKAEVVKVINPKRPATPVKEGRCTFFRPKKKIRLAKGFAKTNGMMPRDIGDGLRWRLIGYFGKNQYYEMRNGKRYITPEDQAYIVKLAAKLGYPTTEEQFFEEFEERIVWED